MLVSIFFFVFFFFLGSYMRFGKRGSYSLSVLEPAAGAELAISVSDIAILSKYW